MNNLGAPFLFGNQLLDNAPPPNNTEPKP